MAGREIKHATDGGGHILAAPYNVETNAGLEKPVEAAPKTFRPDRCAATGSDEGQIPAPAGQYAQGAGLHAADAISTGRRIAKNFLSLSVANFACKGLSFLSTAYLARVLSAEGYGVLGFAQAVLVYFQLLINQGFDTFGAREIARSPSETRRYVNNILTIRFILAAVSYSLLALFAILIPKPAVVKAAVLIFGAGLFNSTFSLKWVFMGRERMEWIAASRLIPQLLYLAAILILIHRPEQLLRVPMIQVGTVAAAVLGLIILYRRSVGSISFEMDPSFWKTMFRQSLPMAATYLLIQIYVSFDMIFLGFTHGERTVGYYNAAYKMINMINLFGIYYFTSLFPNISRLYVESIERLKMLLSRSLRLVGMVAMPLGVGGTILAGPIVLLTFGQGFAASALPFKLLIWNVAIMWISFHYGNALMGCNLQNRYMIAVALGAVSNIVLNVIFIPRFGMKAAALTTILSEIMVLLLTYRELKKVMNLGFLSILPRPLFASLGMGALLVLMPEWNVFSRIILGIIFYFPLLYLCGGIKAGDLARIKLLVKGRRESVGR